MGNDAPQRVNLGTDPWLPVVTVAGQPARMSLRDLLASAEARQVRALGGDPPVAVAALRLLLAILHDALAGPSTDEVWARWWRAGSWPTATVAAYLDQHQHRFNLFDDEHPFGQDQRVTDLPRKSVAELLPHRASGNNPVLWSHNTGLEGGAPLLLSPADAACWLLADHQFSRAGMFPTVTRGRLSAPQGLLTNRAVTYPVGATLVETVLLNLVTYTARPDDVPPWRRDTVVVAGPPPGLVSLLSWQTRNIILFGGAVVDACVRVVEAVDYTVSVQTLERLDPHLAFRTTMLGDRAAVVYDPSVAVWRVAAKLVAGANPDTSAVGAVVRRAVAHGLDLAGVRLETAGLAMESFAKPVDWARTTVPVAVGSDMRSWAVRATQYAEDAARALATAAKPMLAQVGVRQAGSGHPGVVRDMVTALWAALDLAGRSLLADLGAGDDGQRAALLDGWRERVDLVAFAVLADAITVHPVVAGAAALATARTRLQRELSAAAASMEMEVVS